MNYSIKSNQIKLITYTWNGNLLPSESCFRCGIAGTVGDLGAFWTDVAADRLPFHCGFSYWGASLWSDVDIWPILLWLFPKWLGSSAVFNEVDIRLLPPPLFIVAAAAAAADDFGGGWSSAATADEFNVVGNEFGWDLECWLGDFWDGVKWLLMCGEI